MKKLVLSLIICLVCSGLAYASGAKTRTVGTAAATNYPVVLSHGMGASATISLFGIGILDYWYGIIPALQSNGAKVYTTSVNGMDTTANKGAAWKAQVLQILAVTGKAKVNVIGHSHGGLYTRYAISNLGMYPKVATLTTIASPHRGSAVADVIVGTAGDVGGWLIGGTLDVVYALIFGDTNPNSLQNGREVTRAYCINTFNPNTPNKTGVYYQSWTGKIKTVPWNAPMAPTALLLAFYEPGGNDGLVSITSAKWGTYRGLMESAWWNLNGVDHLEEVGQILGITPGWSAPDFFVSVVKDLKTKGY